MSRRFILNSILLLNVFSLQGTDIRSISYLELPPKKIEATLSLVQEFTLNENLKTGISSSDRELYTNLLKSYLNQVDLLIDVKEKQLLSEYSEKLASLINGSFDSYPDYYDWMFTFCRTLKRIEYVPNPPTPLVKKRNEVIKLCQLLNERISKDYVDRFYQEVNLDKFSRITLGNLSLGNDLMTEKYLKYKVMSLEKQERIYHYHEWLPKLESKNVKNLYKSLEIDERLIFIEQIFTSCDLSSVMLSHFKELLEELTPQLTEKLYTKSIKEGNKTLIAILKDLLPNLSTDQVNDELMKPLPGRYGSDQVYTVSIGETDLFFYMDQEKFSQSLRIVSDVNTKTIIGVDKIADTSSDTGYTTAYQKYSLPLGYSESKKPVHFDPFGYQTELDLLNSNAESLRRLLQITPKYMRGKVDLCINHTGMKWNPVTKLDFVDLNSLNSSLGKPWYFLEYTLADWQLSPGVVTGLLINDTDSQDRYIIPLLFRDRFSVCFLQKNDNLKDGDNKVFPEHIQLGAIDYQSSLTPGSTKGKSLNSLFWGYAEESDVMLIKRGAQKLKKNTLTKSKGSKTYNSGLKFTEIPFSTEIENLKLFYVNSAQSVESYRIEGKDYRNLAHKLKKYMNVKGHFTQAFRVIKQTQGLSQFSQMDLPLSDNCTVVCINRSCLPKNYLHLPIAEDGLKTQLPWIHLFHMPKEFCLKTEGRVFKQLALTPLEEILFRDVLKNENSTGLYKDMEKFETQLDILIFEE